MRGNASKNIRNFNVNVGAGFKPARFFIPFPQLCRGKPLCLPAGKHGGLPLHFIIIIVLFIFVSCGSKGNDAPEINPTDSITKEITPEDMIMSDRYLGEIVVHFRDDLVVRLYSSPPPNLPPQGGGAFTTTKPQPQFEVRNFYYQSLADNLNRILEEHQVEVRRYLTMRQDEYDIFKRDLEELNSEELPDLNSIYYFKAEPKEAIVLYNRLKNFYGVEYIYPHLQKVLTAVTTPDLSPQQGYLTANGGIDAFSAWNQGVTGKGVHIYNDDAAYNFFHEDLQLNYTVYDEKNNPKGSLVGEKTSLADHLPMDKQPYYISCGIDCMYLVIGHGTAVAGIVNASHNNGTGNFGVKGIAPDAKLLAGNPPVYYKEANIFPLGDDHDSNTFPGSVHLIESAVVGKDGKINCKFGDPCYNAGQLPSEVVPDKMKYFQTLSAMGITVVEGAGNSNIDIGDANQYTGQWSVWINPTTQDSGAIIVGASEGANMQKASFSNYSSRLDAYSWGSSIVTTSYPYGDATTSPFYWKGAGGPPSQDPVNDKHKFYTNHFGGTSGATAIVGGAVTLVQSRFMQLAGNGRMRYIMPKKIRELMRSSGDNQKDTTGKNIGVQPKMDRLLKAVDNYWQSISAQYPALKLNPKQLSNINRMTKQEIISMRVNGVGLVCIKHDPDGSSSDPLCSDDLLWPRGDQMSVDMDIDGDGLMDIVSWKRGEFKIDLSSKGTDATWCSDLKGVREPDGYCNMYRFSRKYGSWDLIINYADINSKWILPYVKDMDADHRSDLMLYDKEHGKWYIEYMNVDYINGSENRIVTWDKELQYDWKDELNIDPWKSKYSRPAVADLIGNSNKPKVANNWADISILCSDGYWRVDLGGPNNPDGKWDIEVKYLTDEQLKVAPGWAYQPYVSSQDSYETDIDDKVEALFVKTPDTLPAAGRIQAWTSGVASAQLGQGDDYERCKKIGLEKCGNPIEPKLNGGNELILMPPDYWMSSTAVGIVQLGVNLALIENLSFSNAAPPIDYTPIAIDASCKPLLTKHRYIFQCKDEWIIVADSYRCSKWEKKTAGKNICTDETWGIKHIPLSYNPTDFVLPGRPYVGGISYLDTQKIIQNSLLEHPNTPPPIIVDMPMVE
ncbi:MAG: S8 family serine peptidase [Pseudomonadota bacterium]